MHLERFIDSVDQLKYYLREEDILSFIFAELFLFKENVYRHDKYRDNDIYQIKQLGNGNNYYNLSSDALKVAKVLYEDLAITSFPQKMLRQKETENLFKEIEALTHGEDIRVVTQEIYSLLCDKFLFLRSKSLPYEITKLMEKLCDLPQEKGDILDPYCGSGILLSQLIKNNSMCIEGLEKNLILCRFAQVYIYLCNEKFIQINNKNPLYFKMKTNKEYDLIASMIPSNVKINYNPDYKKLYDPFSMFQRFGELALSVWNICKKLKKKGNAVLLIPNGLLFRGGNDYKLREIIVENGWLKSVIYLPPRVLRHTSTPCSIITLSKNSNSQEVKLIDIEGNKEWVISGRQNCLNLNAIDEIVSIIKKDQQKNKFTKVIKAEELKKNGFQLNRQFYFNKADLQQNNNKTIDEMKNDVKKAYENYQRAHHDIMKLLNDKL